MELNYDIDNFSGNYNRGVRYDIYDGDTIIYHDVPEECVDKLAEEMEGKPWLYQNIEIKQIK